MIELTFKTKQNFFCQIIQFLKDIGFNDITEEYPIHFHEQIHTTFSNVYTLQNRLRRTNGKLVTEILIGKEGNWIHVIGTSVYKEYSNTFELKELKNYIFKSLLRYIYANESEVITRFNNHE